MAQLGARRVQSGASYGQGCVEYRGHRPRVSGRCAVPRNDRQAVAQGLATEGEDAA